MLRFLTAGESHGPAEVAIVEGMPAGLSISHADIQKELEKRRGGAGRGGRGKIEGDQVKILSGVRFGKTLGSPIALLVENNDFANWKGRMDVEDDPFVDKEAMKATTPRPGHTDLAGSIKYGTDDIRNILERASARETVMRVAVGAICKKFLLEFGIEIASHTIQIGSVSLRLPRTRFAGPLRQSFSEARASARREGGTSNVPATFDGGGDPDNENPNSYFQKVMSVYETDPDIRCIDPETSQKMKDLIRHATIQKNTLGGVVEIIAHNVPIGLGSHVHWDRKLDGRLAQALMSIPSVKAVEVGEGIVNTTKFGSDVHDEILPSHNRKTNRAGGIEGGISNGQDIICRVYHKPISTLGNPLNTVDIKTKQPTKALIERSDICVVPRAGVISESMITYEIAYAFLEKFGGDAIVEVRRNFEGYQQYLTTR